MPGDLTLADHSGVLVLPVDEAREVGEAALKRQERGRLAEIEFAAGRAKLGGVSGATDKILARLRG